MRIPKHTINPRFYVATSQTTAFSSWPTMEQARKAYERLKRFDAGAK